MASTPTLVYWALNARGTPAYVVAALGNVELKWDDATANTWPAPKASAPFGQLPLLKDGDLTLGQSMAIVRYLARKGGVDSDNGDLRSAGISEMITEEAADLFSGLAKSKYGADPLADYTKFFKETLPAQYQYLENLLHADFFSGAKALQGDAALYAALYLIRRCSAEHADAALAGFPKLSAWIARFEAIPSIEKAKAHLDTLNPYFTWPV